VLAKIRATIVFVALLVAAPLSADKGPPKDFDTLVRKGDHARIAGKWSDALEAYAKALELRDEPLVAGRIGLVLLEFREYDAAAIQLLRAIERGAGLSDGERSRFFQAFLLAPKANVSA
jgi:tetratricopeptide (TPR) repeat protein